MNSSMVYFLGFLLVIAGLAYGAIMLGVPSLWVGIGALVLVGIALMSTVTNTKRPSAADGEVTRTTTTVTEEA
ncbi:hypothetical protein [Sphingomicrobium astaxanthinifaciens]|uniref:hypothetical protein n=1 Tax=Sphingomicrobium astaxanthinifaciens TaxID=1227949 RepID=UPI001FCB70AF|nr:hypothetical protein [Sphingomicrobium astaxanthinifaciens]MCJ7420922.1 hypothetical protein [Sphingomicrobium astaxanthinifaciens]